MKNNKIILALSCAFMMAGGTAHADEYRLAFSKSEQIEIIVNNANQDNWCSTNLKLEARYLAAPNPEGLATLMPKIGQLMQTQCPQATKVSWVSTSQQGKQLASGSSSATTGWALKVTPAAQENNPATVAATTQAQEPTPSAALETKNELAIAPVPEQIKESLKQVEPATPVTRETTATMAATPENNVEAEKNVADNKVASVQKKPDEPAENDKTIAVEPKTQSKEQSTDSALPAAPKLAFEVNGWKPNANPKELLKAVKLQEVVDQNGCKLLVSLANTSFNMDYTLFQTEGLQCSNGFAQGSGKAGIIRSDGQTLSRKADYHFANGLGLHQGLAEISALTPVAADPNQQRIWLYLGEDPEEKSYYLLGLKKGWGTAPYGPWEITGLDIITEQNEIFRKQNLITEQINKALAQHPWLQNQVTRLDISFFSDFNRGLLENQVQGKLYSTRLQRNQDWRTKKIPAWNITSVQGNNYLFQRDELKKREEARLAQEAARKKQREEQQHRYEQQRLAQQKRQALYNIASQEERNLQRFKAFETALQNGEPNLLAQNLSGIEFTPFGRSDYYRLMNNRSKDISLLVRINKVDSNTAQVNWPYPLELNSPAELEKGWYWISGKASMDNAQPDANQQPVIRVAIDSPSQLLKCEQEMCKDLESPLALTRIALKNANWDIAQAQDVIKEYEEAKKASY